MITLAPRRSPRRPWTTSAACRTVDPRIFHPEGTEPPAGGEPVRLRAKTWPAKQVCAVCPVKRPCLLFALDQGDRHGVWGGLDWIERAALGPNPSGEAITEALSHVGLKLCLECRTEKPVGQFQRRGGSYRSPCEDCRKPDDSEGVAA